MINVTRKAWGELVPIVLHSYVGFLWAFGPKEQAIGEYSEPVGREELKPRIPGDRSAELTDFSAALCKLFIGRGSLPRPGSESRFFIYLSAVSQEIPLLLQLLKRCSSCLLGGGKPKSRQGNRCTGVFVNFKFFQPLSLLSQKSKT